MDLECPNLDRETRRWHSTSVLDRSKLLMIVRLLIFPLGILFVWYASPPGPLPKPESVSSQVRYQRVVRIIGYEDIFVSYQSEGTSDNFVNMNYIPERTGRRLLDDEDNGAFRMPGGAVHTRSRRDYDSRAAEYEEVYRQYRAANLDSASLSTQNEILHDDLDGIEGKQRTKGIAPKGTSKPNVVQGDHSNNGRENSSEDLSEMEISYRKTYAECNARMMEEHRNNTPANGTNSHGGDQAHQEKCSGEVESGVPALWVLLYGSIILFLFIGLAIICDEFFIASLEAISQRLNLSEDVAGATFMAAGSSAPELFISVAGAGTGSDVGVGTIVGSAVFNLLIIIALTAALAGKVLCLDWRPFVRDSIFYALSIIALIMFSWDTVFEYWESLALLILYVLYIVTMKFNPQLMDFMAKWSCCSCFESRVSPGDEEKPPEQNDVTNEKGRVPAQQAKPATSSVSPATAPKELAPAPDTIVAPPTPERLKAPSVGTSTTKTSGDPGVCTCSAQSSVSRPMACACCVIHVTSQPCAMCAACVSPTPARSSLRCSYCSSAAREEVVVVDGTGQVPDNRSPVVKTTVHKNAWLPSSTASVDTGFGGSQTDKASSVSSLANSSFNGSRISDCQITARDDVLEVTYTEECDDIDNSGPAEDADRGGEDSGESKIVILPCLPAISNPPPEKPSTSQCIPGSKYVASYVVFILSFPWICIFTWTVPNCSKPETRKWYLASFFLCIAWIAFVSYIMIELVEKIGCLLGIDAYTMGLVVVAVGTSVPDAISSVLVAKDGFGDMAVSNALGSNVFDINLGLGLPFFVSSIITAKPVSLLSSLQLCLLDNLPLSVRIVPHVKFGLILLLVLLVAVCVFMFVRFRLNRQVTFLFIAMYGVFMVYAFVQEKSCHSFFC